MAANKKHKQQVISDTLSNVRGITRHIRNVQDNCILLGEKLIEQGEIEFGKTLIANGMKHDVSKFQGIEYEYMAPLFAKVGASADEPKKLKLKIAIQHHNSTNYHHPEAWESIHEMPDVFIAEMVCDWKARSEEFGSSLRDFISSTAMKRWEFTEEDQVYKLIMTYVDLLCERPFSQT